MQEIMHVFVVRNDTGRDAVILDCETSPLDRRAAQRRTRRQEWLDATLAHDFDAGNRVPVDRCPVLHVDASNPRNLIQAGKRGAFRGLILNEFQEICTVSVFWNCARNCQSIG